MIFPDKKLVYIKIPKTGSSTIWEYINKLDAYHSIINLNRLHGVRRDPRCFSRGQGKKGGHVAAQDIAWYLGDAYDTYFKFTIVRDPFARLLSNYSWQFSKGSTDLDFSRFVDKLINRPRTLPKQALTHSIPQINWITNEDGEVIIDRIGRLENLTAEMASICAENNLPQMQLGHRNMTHHAHYSNYYTDEIREMAAQFLATDLQSLDYQFEDKRDPDFVLQAITREPQSDWGKKARDARRKKVEKKPRSSPRKNSGKKSAAGKTSTTPGRQGIASRIGKIFRQLTR